MAYTSVFFALTPLIILSGMAMSPQLNAAFHSLPAMFGGRQSARSIHFILTFLFVGFTFGHVFMVLVTGVLNNMRSIVTGWYNEKVSEKPETAWLQDVKEEMIQKPAKVPVSHQLSSPEVEEIPPAQETLPASVEPEQQDNGVSNSSTQEEHSGPESSTETSRMPTREAKKDIAE